MITTATTANLIVIVTSFCLSAASLESADPFNGTWRITVEKSRFHNAPFQGTLTLRDNVSQFVAIDLDGRALWSRTYEWKYDGQPKRVISLPQKRASQITEAITRIDDRTLECLTRRGRHVIARTVFTLSPDCRSITATTVGETPAGEIEDSTVVFERYAPAPQTVAAAAAPAR